MRETQNSNLKNYNLNPEHIKQAVPEQIKYKIKEIEKVIYQKNLELHREMNNLHT